MTAPRVQCPELAKWLAGMVSAGDRVLDVGCGTKWYWPHLQARGATVFGLDAHAEFAPDFLMDLERQDTLAHLGPFDVVLVLDLIEHLERGHGERMLPQFQRLSKRSTILLTPLEWDDNAGNVVNPDSPYFGNEYNYHRSLWGPQDFEGWRRVEHLRFTRPTRKTGGFFLGVWEND